MPTRALVIHTNAESAPEAGAELAAKVRAAWGETPPDAVILFASPRFDYPALLKSFDEACVPRALIGASSAGEFTSEVQGVGMACAIALQSDEMRFRAVSARGLSKSQPECARHLVSEFQGLREPAYPYRTGLVLMDALAGQAEEFVEALTVHTGGLYSFAGGGAGGDDSFDRRFVFHGREAFADGAVALEILSRKPVGIGVRHGWKPVSSPMRVTETEGTVLKSFNARPAGEVFAEHAEKSGQPFDRAQALPFFLHNILGMQSGQSLKLRVPLAVNAKDEVTCATEVPTGSLACIMGYDFEAAGKAAAESTQDALNQLEGNAPAVALFFDCVATRLRLGKSFGLEVDAVAKALGATPLAGCNTIGQIARSEAQFSGFHNCTAVVCVLPA